MHSNKQKTESSKDLKMKNINIKLIKDGDTYKYLGIDEKTSYVGTVNKDRVMKEYLTRVKKKKHHSNLTEVT